MAGTALDFALNAVLEEEKLRRSLAEATDIIQTYVDRWAVILDEGVVKKTVENVVREMDKPKHQIDWVQTGGKPTSEIDEWLPKKKQTGGFLDTLIGGKNSKLLSSIMGGGEAGGAGAAAGAGAAEGAGLGAAVGAVGGPAGMAVGAAIVAAGMLLANAIQDAIKQSKIASTISENISKALGLLMDLILMPFLPLIMWVLIGLYQTVMFLGNVWNATVRPLTEALSKFLEYLGTLATDIANKVGEWLTTHIVDPIIKAIDNFFPGFKKAWDDFWADPLGTLSRAWEAFWKDPLGALNTAWKVTWTALIDWLLEQPVIGPALKLAGVKSSAERAEEELKRKSTPEGTLQRSGTASIPGATVSEQANSKAIVDAFINRTLKVEVVKMPMEKKDLDPSFAPISKDMSGDFAKREESTTVSANFTINIDGVMTKEDVKVIARDEVKLGLRSLRVENQTGGG